MKYIYLPKTRKEAKKAGLKHYMPDYSCKRGHYARRRTHNYTCEECAKLKTKRRYKISDERFFPDGTTPKARHYQETKRSMARSRKAVPKWSETQEIWETAKKASELGKGYNIDHIVPMKGHFVCGLHCKDNIAIIETTANGAKRHWFWPDMPTYTYEDIMEIYSMVRPDLNFEDVT